MTNPTSKPRTTTAVVPTTPSHDNITIPDTTRNDGWARERMIAFLEALVETAPVSVAAQSVGMMRRSACYLRARLMGQPFDHIPGRSPFLD